MSRALVALVAAVTFGGLVAPAPASAGAAADGVVIQGSEFTPERYAASLGATITWTNQDDMQHTVTSDDGLFDTGAIDGSGGTASLTFDSAGRFYYHCSFHSFMHGRVVVPMVVVSGSAADGWKLRWATARATGSVAFDVQYKRLNADHYTTWRHDTAAASGRLDPARPGHYAVRARTSDTDTDESSAWSPAVQLTIS